MSKREFNNEILWLALDGEDYISKKINDRGVNIYSTLRGKHLFIRMIRKFHLKYALPAKQIWYGKWKYVYKDAKVIIIYASKPAIDIAKYLKSKTDARLIFLYMNIAKTTVNPNEVPDDLCEKWSFDEEDCKTYNMNFNTQFYFDDISLSNSSIERDVLFIGADKGRYEQLKELEKKLNDRDISTYFHITSSKKINISNKEKFAKWISYETIINYISTSKVIVDIVQEGQVGLTRRPLEALFLSKKLITNDKSIKLRDFYSKENIFIIGEDDFGNIKQFINTPFLPLNNEIIDKYDFNNWMRRFLKGEK